MCNNFAFNNIVSFMKLQTLFQSANEKKRHDYGRVMCEKTLEFSAIKEQ